MIKETINKVSINDKIYNEVSSLFLRIFGDYCGWAHSVLLAAELPAYKTIIDESKKIHDKKRRLNKESNDSGLIKKKGKMKDSLTKDSYSF